MDTKNNDKKMIKIIIFMGMIFVFLVLFFIFILITQMNATAQNTKEIKTLEWRIDKLEKRQ